MKRKILIIFHTHVIYPHSQSRQGRRGKQRSAQEALTHA